MEKCVNLIEEIVFDLVNATIDVNKIFLAQIWKYHIVFASFITQIDIPYGWLFVNVYESVEKIYF